MTDTLMSNVTEVAQLTLHNQAWVQMEERKRKRSKYTHMAKNNI